MCGIVGVLQYQSGVPRAIRQKAIKILFSDTMLQTEVRGDDATGIYQVHTDGDWAMTKKGEKVSNWLFLDREKSDDPVVYSDFMDAWLDHKHELTSLVGHCRKATIGSKGKDNDDNHPFAIQLDESNAILGIHNGTLTNHERIFSKLPPILKRQGQVDSEAIFHLMFHLSEHGTKPWDEEMMRKLGKRLDGAAACIVVNTRFPNLVATWRFGRPMEYIMIAPLNIVLICSERKFAQSALEKYEMYRLLFDNELPALEVYDTALTDKDFRIFDTSKTWPAGKPIYGDLAKLSVVGAMRTFNSGLEEGWYTPAKGAETSTGTGAGSHSHTGQYSGTSAGAAAQAHTSKAGTRSGAASGASGAASAIKALTATAGGAKKSNDDGDIKIVEVEIGSQAEAEGSIERAKSMGVCTHFDGKMEVARALGITQLELDKLNMVDFSNQLSRMMFNLGYAVARFDTKGEVEKIRKKGRDLTRRLEKAEAKKGRGENRIWELKQLITLMLSLSEANYSITQQNVDLSLTAFPKLGVERRRDISEMARSIFSDRNVAKVVRSLGLRYKQAKNRKKRQDKEQSAEG
jgi:hypothetical protein